MNLNIEEAILQIDFNPKDSHKIFKDISIKILNSEFDIYTKTELISQVSRTILGKQIFNLSEHLNQSI